LEDKQMPMGMVLLQWDLEQLQMAMVLLQWGMVASHHDTIQSLEDTILHDDEIILLRYE
jgi:hypothetical protein